MAKTGVLFSEDAARRISRVVRKVEGQPRGEGGRRRRRVPGQATVLWGKLTSDFDSGAANTLKANPCDADGNDVVSEIELVLYVEIPIGRTPDRSCFAAYEVVGYVPYGFRDAEGQKTADGFLVGVLGPEPDDGLVKVAKIVENLGAGLYIIAPQIWDPDLGTPAWKDTGYTVTGDGGGSAGSPNGDYVEAGVHEGEPYYTLNGFDIWWLSPRWRMSLAHGDESEGSWYSDRDAPVTGVYSPGFPYTGNPVVAATSLNARDISENPNGAVGQFVVFWQQLDDNGQTETVIFIALPNGSGVAQMLFWDNTDGRWVLTAAPASPSTKDYVLMFDHTAAHGVQVKWVEAATFVCP